MHRKFMLATTAIMAAMAHQASSLLVPRHIPEPRPSNSKRRRYTTLHKTNGNREVSRRLRQEVRALAKRAIEYINIGEGPYQRSEAVTVWDQLCSDPSEYAKFRKATPEQLIEIRNNLQVDLGLSAA